MKPANITPISIHLRRRFGSVAKAAVSLGFKYHRIRRIAAGQQPATEEERTLINDAIGVDVFDPGQRYADVDRAAQARLIKLLSSGEGLALVRRLRTALWPEEL
jgi:hypothetical protein